MPLNQTDAKALVELRHDEWREHELTWRKLLDAHEGGERYRQAIYGYDRHGYPIRNLVRHKREYPDPRDVPGANGRYGTSVYLEGTAQGMAGGAGLPMLGLDPAQFAQDDDYELRRARTPVPTFVAEAADAYLAKVYSGEIDRDAPEGPAFDRLRAWWADVDGCGTTVDEWMAQVVGPLLLVLGQLDVLVDHPAAPPGEPIRSVADAAKVAGCVAGYILPENMLWWRLDARRRYAECLVQEYRDGGEQLSGMGLGPIAAVAPQPVRYRHWTDRESSLYDRDGNLLATQRHPYGRPPIVRVFDRRKPRCRNVGRSRMESIAERQREYYNRDSELILSDTLQAHPLLQGPEDYIQEDGTIPIGPAWLLPKKKNTQGGAASYEGFEVVEFPKDGADSIRRNKQEIRDDVDRDACLTKPAGAAGTTGATVAQSGVSKSFDHDALHAKLSAVAGLLGKAEAEVKDLVLLVLFDGHPPAAMAEKARVAYPTVFSLYAADQLAAIASDFQEILTAAGEAPEVETAILCEIVRKALPGRDDATYEAFDDEIGAKVAAKAKASAERAEAMAGLPAATRLGLPASGVKPTGIAPPDGAGPDDFEPADAR